MNRRQYEKAIAVLFEKWREFRDKNPKVAKKIVAKIRALSRELTNRYPIRNPRGAGGRPRKPAGPRLFVVKVFGRNNSGVLKLYTYAMSSAQAIQNTGFRPGGAVARIGAAPTAAKGKNVSPFAISNPVKEKRAFMAAVVSDPFYKTLLIKGAQRLIALLKEGKFNRREWLQTIEAIVERIAKENKISLTRMEKLKIALTLARQLWDSTVHGKR